MVGIIILFAILLLLVLLLFIPVVIQLYVSNKELSIELVLLKVIKIKIKEKTTFEKLKKKKVSKEKVPLGKLIEIIKKSLPSIKYLASRTEVDVIANGTIGLSSADKTALTIGILNILLYNLESVIHIYFREYSGEYNIVPDFVYEKFEFNLNSKIYIKPVNIIMFFIKWFKILMEYKKYIFRKGGASNAGSSNRRIDENYNG